MRVEIAQPFVSKERAVSSPFTKPSEFRSSSFLLGDSKVIAAGSVPGKNGTLNAM
jgi:hypothetical protein